MIYPIPPRNTFGKEDFVYWENFLLEEDIDLLLSRPEWEESKVGQVGEDDFVQATKDEHRRSYVSWLDVSQETMPIWERFACTVAQVNSRFFHYDLTGFCDCMQLTKYTEHEKGHYDWHTDSRINNLDIPRKLSLVMLLSDPSEFEGGDFQIKRGMVPETLECKKGRAWIFPSYLLHRVTPVTKGVRKSLVLWAGGPQFR